MAEQLCLAVLDKDYPRVLQLLAAGANPNEVHCFSDNDAHVLRKEPPIVTASRTGNEAVIKLLLSHGANVNLTTEVDGMGMTALHWACIKHNKDIARFLLKHGANVNQADYYYETPLLEAVCSSRLDMVQLLVLNNADMNRPVNSSHDTPLLYAVMTKKLDIVTFLIGAGADINKTNHAGEDVLGTFFDMHTPVNTAQFQEVYQFVEYLLDAGCKASLKPERDSPGERTCPHHKDEVIQKMIEHCRSRPRLLGQQCRDLIRTKLLTRSKGLCILQDIYRLPLPIGLLKHVALNASLHQETV